jgi:hypothetical protein
MARLTILASLSITLALTLIGIARPSVDAARQATPAAASPATPDSGEALNLPALVLLPADLVAVGLDEGFGIYGGDLDALAAAAEQTASSRGADPTARVAEFTSVLEDARFRQSYYLHMAPPADSPVGIGLSIASSVEEYADAAGAASSFATFADKSDLVEVEVTEVAGARRFGDESLTLRGSGIDPTTGAAYQAVSIEARAGRLLPAVTIFDYSNQPPDLAVAEALMERLMERIARETRPARGELGYLVARLRGEGVETWDDRYGRLNGESIPVYADTAESLASREPGIAVMREIYYLQQTVPAGGAGYQDDILYNVGLHRFASPAEAAAWFDGFLFGSPERTLVTGMPPLGEQAITFRREFDQGEGVMAPGLVTYVRSGTDVLRIAVSGPWEVELAGYEALLARTVECLSSEFCLEPVPVPRELVGSEGIATPQATPLPS